MTDIHRRDFLKYMGLTGAGLATGCAQETGEIVPYLRPPAGIRPEIPAYFATICRECPAGCGMLAKNRDGRVIKPEGPDR